MNIHILPWNALYFFPKTQTSYVVLGISSGSKSLTSDDKFRKERSNRASMLYHNFYLHNFLLGFIFRIRNEHEYYLT